MNTPSTYLSSEVMKLWECCLWRSVLFFMHLLICWPGTKLWVAAAFVRRGAMWDALPSVSGVLQVDGFHCVILSLYTDPSLFWTPPRQELAHSLSVANGLLIESPQVVYLLVEVNREWCDQDTHLHRPPSPVISQQECCLHIPVSILIPPLHVEAPVGPRLWFDLFHFLSCERITDIMLSFHADLMHYSGLHAFVSQVSFNFGGILRTPSDQNDVIGQSDLCVSAIESEGSDQCKLLWRIDPLPLKVRYVLGEGCKNMSLRI